MQLFLAKSLAFYIGCFSCYFLQQEWHLSAVTAAALTGLAGSFIDLPRYYEKKGLHAVIYAGAFAGMCSPKVLTGPLEILLLSMMGAALYLYSRPYAQGFGGKLGTISFITSLLFFVMRTYL